jgi:hypothetical protein
MGNVDGTKRQDSCVLLDGDLQTPAHGSRGGLGRMFIRSTEFR